jgi:ABC transporter DrrB family efflux protein
MSTFTPTLPLPARVGLAAAVRQALVMTRRSLLRIKTNPEELGGLTLMPVMFVLLFTFVFGDAIAGSTAAYLQFALPGIVVQGVFFSTMYTGYYLNTDILNGIFDRFRTLPIARSAPLVGQVLGDLARYAIGIVVTLGVGMALGFRVRTGPGEALAAFATLMAVAFAFSWVWTLLGVTARSAAVVQLVGSLLMFPLTFASSVFVPAHTLPGWLNAWSQISPVTLLSDTTRAMLLGGDVAGPGLKTLAWSVAVVVVFAPLSVRAYRRKV